MNHRRKMKAKHSQLIPRKLTENLVINCKFVSKQFCILVFFD